MTTPAEVIVRRPKLTLLAIFMLYFTASEFGILTPAIQALTVAFSTTPFATIMLANTITGVVSIPVTIFAGYTVKKYGYRLYGILGILLVGIGGIYPMFLGGIDVYWPIVLSRVIVGVGLGFVNPLGSAVILRLYEGHKRSLYLGIGNCLMLGSGILFALMAGALCTIAWNYTFAAYALTIIPIVCVVLWLPELKDPKGIVTGTKEAEQAKPVSKEPFPVATVAGYSVITLVSVVALVSLVMESSIILATKLPGSEAWSGSLTAAYNAGGLVAGLIFTAILAALKKRAFAGMAFVGAIGMVVVYYSNSVPLIILGMFLAGFSYLSLLTACQNAAGNATPADRTDVTASIIMALMNLASFFATYWILASQSIFPAEGPQASVVTSGIVMLVLAVIFLFLPFKNLLKRPESEDEA